MPEQGRDGLADSLSWARAELEEVESSAMWRVVRGLRRHKERIIPLGSRRERVWARVKALAGRVAPAEQPAGLPAAVERLARAPGRPRVLLVGGPGGATRRYRCTHLLEALEELGGAGTILDARNPTLSHYPAELAESCDLLLLHRAPATAVAALITEFRARSLPVLYDADDLVFDPEQSFPEGVARVVPRGDAEQQRQSLALADAALVATEPLRERVEQLGGRAFVLRNGFSRAMRIAAEQASPRPPDDRFVLGYASGSPTHAADFARCADALLELLDAHANLELLLIGPLPIDARFRRFGRRVRRERVVPWRDLFGLLASLDVNLAPLDLTHPFAQAKSELKWLEAALVGVPTVASATPAFHLAIRDGVDGCLVESREEWRERIDGLIADPVRARAIGAAAHAKATRDYPLSARVEQLRTILAGL